MKGTLHRALMRRQYRCVTIARAHCETESQHNSGRMGRGGNSTLGERSAHLRRR